MKETQFWWVRHAPVTAHGGLVYGASDVPADVSDAGVFRALAALLPRRARWIASGLARTEQTAAATARAAGHPRPPLQRLPALNEQHFGEWQGRPVAEVYGRHGHADGFWLAPATTRPPGGESFEEVVARVARAVEALAREYEGERLCLFAHGGPIRAALALALGLDPAAALAFRIDNCSITRLDRIGPAWRVECVNRPPGPLLRTS